MLNKLIKLKNEDGSVIVILALAFSMLLGLTALVIDIGIVALEKTRLVRTLDATVLAGAQELPNTSKAFQTAYEYAVRNELDPSLLTVNFPVGNQQITATSSKTVDLYFAQILGFNQIDVSGRATARIAPVSSTTGLIPIGLDESQMPLVPGQQYSIKVGAHDAETGWLGVLAYPGQSGADDYRNSARYGYDGVVQIGQNMDKATGNVSGPTTQGIEDRIATANETWDNYSPNSERVAFVPIYRILGNQPSDKVRVTGFASVFLEQVTGQGNESYVLVRYVQHTVSGETDDSISGSFLNSVRLIE